MPSASSSGRRSYGTRPPDAKRQPATLGDALEDPRRAEPAVLVVDRNHAATGGDTQAFSRRLHELVLGRHRESGAELPGRLLAQDPVRPTRLVAFNDTAVDLQVAFRACECRRVEPRRVVVLREEERRRVSRDGVERRGRGLLVPLGGAPAVPAYPGAVSGMRAHSLERVREAGRPFELHLALRDRPRREVDVRIGEAGKDAAAAEIDDIRAGKRQLVRPDAARHVRSGDRERASRRQRRIHSADDAVLEDHARRL